MMAYVIYNICFAWFTIIIIIRRILYYKKIIFRYILSHFFLLYRKESSQNFSTLYLIISCVILVSKVHLNVQYTINPVILQAIDKY